VFVWNERGLMLWFVELNGEELLETVEEEGSLVGGVYGMCGVCSVRGHLSGGEEGCEVDTFIVCWLSDGSSEIIS
jgi:hypothetical protein